MGSLTIRNLDDSIKRRLRLRAAARNRSMEDEARHILRAALAEAEVPSSIDLATRIRARFAGLEESQLPVPEREAVREPPDFIDTPAARSRLRRKPPAQKKSIE